MPIYLDCASSTPIDPRVQEVLLHCLSTEYGNASSSTHQHGQTARRAVEKARDQIAAAAGCARGEVVFTSGATESNNLAILGLAEHGRRTGRMHLVSTQIEHHAVLGPMQALAQKGFAVTLVPPTEGGWVEAEAIRAALRPDTLVVSVMQVNNETGVIQPIDGIADVLRGHEAFFHVDAAQGFGKRNQVLRNPRIDLVSISGHKIHGPQGIGALVTRRRNGERPAIEPLLHGGGQERGIRPGTLPVALIAALGRAAELAMVEAEQREERCVAFRTRLLDAIGPLKPCFNGDPERTLPNMVNIAFPGLLSEVVMEALREIVSISNGSACSSHKQTCSHVLGAMGLPNAQAEGALRLSWSYLTPEPDYGRIVQIVRGLQAGAHQSAGPRPAAPKSL